MIKIIQMKKFGFFSKNFLLFLLTVTSTVFATPQVPKDYEGVKATEIPAIEFGKTILGQDFNYPNGQPLIKTHLVEIEAGKETTWHLHAIPVFAYVISGEMTINYGPLGIRTLKAGDSYVEAINVCHEARATSKLPVKIIAVMMSEQGMDLSKPIECDKTY